MRRIEFAVAALILVVGAAGTFTACGDDNGSTTPTVEQTTTQPGGTATTSTSGAVETTPGGAVVPAAPDCAQGQIYSQTSSACVNERRGGNPCPAGEVPAADQPVCEPKD
jgi:hypothetical protein